MKRPLEYALWCDCESDEERAVFLHSGRSVETGVVAPILVPELAEAFLDRASLRAEVERLTAREKRMRGALEEAEHFIDWVGIEDACAGDERERVLKQLREALK